MKGVIESCNRTKSGKSTMILINGTKYLCNKLEIEQYVGKEVECQIGAFKDFKTIESFTVTTSGGAPGRTESGGNSSDRWYMPFVSNTVAHAIGAGQIQSPAQIAEWAKAAKEAAVDIENPY